MFDLIDHVGVADSDLGEAISMYEGTFEMPPVHPATVAEQGVEAALLDVGDGHIELLRPLGPETPVGRFMERSGPGLHHVAYRVADIDATLERLAGAGVELIDSSARVGIRGSRVAFLHPRSTDRVLPEIVEPAAHA